MRAAIITCLLMAAATAGCIRTATPATPQYFVYLVVASAPAGQSECGWYATYAGKDDRYQYLDIAWSNLWRGPIAFFFGGPFTYEKFRCPADQLPAAFPDGLEAAHNAYWGEWRYSRVRTEAFITDYLATGKPELKTGTPVSTPPKERVTN